MQLISAKPDEMMTGAGAVVMLFDQLQNQSSLWESLLTLPQLITTGSLDKLLATAEALFTNIQG